MHSSRVYMTQWNFGFHVPDTCLSMLLLEIMVSEILLSPNLIAKSQTEKHHNTDYNTTVSNSENVAYIKKTKIGFFWWIL